MGITGLFVKNLAEKAHLVGFEISGIILFGIFYIPMIILRNREEASIAIT